MQVLDLHMNILRIFIWKFKTSHDKYIISFTILCLENEWMLYFYYWWGYDVMFLSFIFRCKLLKSVVFDSIIRGLFWQMFAEVKSFTFMSHMKSVGRRKTLLLTIPRKFKTFNISTNKMILVNQNSFWKGRNKMYFLENVL